MKRLIALTMVAAFIALGAGIVMSKAVKVELEPFPFNAPIEAGASGHAILNYVKGTDKTEIQVNCWGLTPGSDYTVYIGSPWEIIGTFTAMKNGSGNLHVRLPGDQSGRLPVRVNNASGFSVLSSR